MTMIRLLIVMCVVSAGVTIAPAARAEFDPHLSITSFVRVGSADAKLAEVCGIVANNDATPVNLDVVVDYNTLNPAPYHTFTGNDGRFCLLVHTVAGVVEVGMMGTLDRQPVRAQLSQ